MGVFKALLHEGWSAPISFLSDAVRPPRGAWGSAGAELAAASPLVPFPPPRGPGVGHGAGAVREHYTQTKQSLHFKGFGLQRCFKTEMCAGFRDGGRALTLCS